MALRLMYSYVLKITANESKRVRVGWVRITGKVDFFRGHFDRVYRSLLFICLACIFENGRQRRFYGQAIVPMLVPLCQGLRRIISASCEYRVGADGMWVLDRRSGLCLPGTNNDMFGVRGINMDSFSLHSKKGFLVSSRQGSMNSA